MIATYRSATICRKPRTALGLCIILGAALLTDENGRPLSLPRGKSITQDALRKAYRRKPSFASRLPWVEYLPESGCFLLEDGISAGVVAEVIPVSTEGRGEEALEAVRDTICATLQDCLPEHDHFPWVLQLYARDETAPREDLERLQSYAHPEVRDSEYTQAWLDSMEAHLRATAKPGGLFVDDVVTDTQWRGQARRTRLVLYRRLGSGKAKLGERRSRRDLRPEDAVSISASLWSVSRKGDRRWPSCRYRTAPSVAVIL